MSDEDKSTLETQAEVEDLGQVRFVYHKARHHRTFHADGAWAGLTPQLEIQFAFFNDLKPMPDEVTHAVNAAGGLGEVVAKTEQPQTVLREANVTVVMNVQAMKNTISLLTHMVEQVELLIQKATITDTKVS